jgi:hypothetical protein
MAKIIPDGWRELVVTGGAQREIETLAVLASELPETYRVYHAVHWTNIGSGKGFSIYGEIDFVVVNQAGDLLLIEQKSGLLEETPEGLVKRYDDTVKRVPAQMARNVAEFQRKLYKRPGCNKVRVENLLYCPDYRVERLETAGLSPDRIIDSRRKDELAAVIQQFLPEHAMSLQATRVDPVSAWADPTRAGRECIGGPGRGAGDPRRRRSRTLGAADRDRAVPAARGGHRRFRQDAARAEGV